MCKLFCLLILVCTSCGYRVAGKDVSTLSIPYVQGDEGGFLTTALIREIAATGVFSYQKSGGEYALKASIVSVSDQQIGYRHDRADETDQPKKNIKASEGRSIVEVEFSIVDSSNVLVFGPRRISAFVDFDFVDQNSLNDLSFINENGKRETVLSFSLGQLEPKFSAAEAAKHPLYRQIAEKIVGVISTEW